MCYEGIAAASKTAFPSLRCVFITHCFEVGKGDAAIVNVIFILNPTNSIRVITKFISKNDEFVAVFRNLLKNLNPDISVDVLMSRHDGLQTVLLRIATIKFNFFVSAREYLYSILFYLLL